MTEKEIKIFEMIGLAITKKGCDYGGFDIQIWTSERTFYGRDYECGKLKGMAKLPFDVSEFLTNWFEENKLYQYIDEDSLVSAELKIIPSERTLQIIGYYSEYKSDEEQVTEYELPDNEEINNLIDNFKSEGHTKLYVTFDGGGDDGQLYLPQVRSENHEDFLNLRGKVFDPLTNFLYQRLQADYGGWENNEGGQGEFIIDLEEKNVTLYFSRNYEVQIPETLLTLKY